MAATARPAGSGKGRRPAPAALKLLEGTAPGRDSGGKRLKAPPGFARAVPHRPDDLSPYAAEMWDAIVADLPSAGLLKKLDGFALRVGCETYARWREAVDLRRQAAADRPEHKGMAVRTSQGLTGAPWVGVEERASREFRAWCAEFGLTPSAEMRLAKETSDGDGDDDNPFAS